MDLGDKMKLWQAILFAIILLLIVSSLIWIPIGIVSLCVLVHPIAGIGTGILLAIIAITYILYKASNDQSEW